jgi:CheY-like chemotaxis protein
MIANKCCFFIGDDAYDQAIFTKALHDVAPNTVCFMASNAAEALHIMNLEGLIPDYIFVELYMPGMDGITFLKTIKQIERLKDIPVIVHSTSPQPHKIIEIKESGAMAIYFRQYEYVGICNMLNLYFNPEMIGIQPN